MRLLITGVCGFVGAALARGLVETCPGLQLLGLDHLGRRGSEFNLPELRNLGVTVFHGDLRCQSDVDALPAVDCVLDCAANPSVLAGAEGSTSSRQLMEHNLLGTLHLLEKCKRDKASFILLSTSRVYSIIPLSRLPVTVHAAAFAPAPGATLPPGISGKGITESFSTTPPVSLYGASKLTSETLALEYGAAFDFPVWINRCGVLAGAGQFGRPDQGIFSYWINAHLRRRPLRFIGFDGAGHQVRDCLHPRDLLPLLRAQMGSANQARCPQVINVSGGQTSARSLAQLTAWCNERFGPHPVTPENMPRPFDLPWVVLDSQLAKSTWQWQPSTPVDVILEEIANHAMEHPAWLDQTA